MTNEEATKLKIGERVSVLFQRGRFSEVCVVAKPGVLTEWNGGSRCIVEIKRLGKNHQGLKPRRIKAIWITQIETTDLITPNVYADYLEERGEYRAADMLRKAFPQHLIDEQPK